MEDIKVFLPQIKSGPDSAKHIITKDFAGAPHALKAGGVHQHFAEFGPYSITVALIHTLFNSAMSLLRRMFKRISDVFQRPHTGH